VEEEGTGVLYRSEVGDVGSDGRGGKQASKVDETTKGKGRGNERNVARQQHRRPPIIAMSCVKGAIEGFVIDPVQRGSKAKGGMGSLLPPQSPAINILYHLVRVLKQGRYPII
jgi:hypothetical protein